MFHKLKGQLFTAQPKFNILKNMSILPVNSHVQFKFQESSLQQDSAIFPHYLSDKVRPYKPQKKKISIVKTEATKYNIILTFVLMIQKCSSFSSMQHHGVHAASVLVPRASRQLGFPGKTKAASIACKIGVPRSSNIPLTIKLN